MLGGLFSALGKGAAAVGKGASKGAKYSLGKVQEGANKASGYEPNLKGPAPKVETDTFGNTSLSMPKVQDPNSFKGRGGVAGGIKRVITGDPQAGGEKGTPKPAGSASAPEPKRAATGKLQPPLEYEKSEFNPNWRNWKSKPSVKPSVK